MYAGKPVLFIFIFSYLRLKGLRRNCILKCWKVVEKFGRRDKLKSWFFFIVCFTCEIKYKISTFHVQWDCLLQSHWRHEMKKKGSAIEEIFQFLHHFKSAINWKILLESKTNTSLCFSTFNFVSICTILRYISRYFYKGKLFSNCKFIFSLFYISHGFDVNGLFLMCKDCIDHIEFGCMYYLNKTYLWTNPCGPTAYP